MDDLETPFDGEAEARLLGSFLVHPELLAGVDLDEQDFWVGKNRLLYRRLHDLAIEFEDTSCITIDTLGLYLKNCNVSTEEDSGKHSDFERLDGYAGLTEYSQSSLVAEAVPFYAVQIRNLRIKRDALIGSHKVANYAANGKPPEEVITEIQQLQETLTMKLPTTQIEPAEAIADNVIADILKRVGNDDETVGIPSGIASLDKLINGWRPGQLIVVAGRPGMGKTQFALNLMHLPYSRGLKKNKFRTLFFSLEMTNQELVERLFSQLSEIPSEMLLKGHVGEFELQKLQAAKARIADMDLVLLDQTEKLNTVQAIEAQIQARKRAGKMPDLVIVDHLGYLTGGQSRKDGNRNLEVEERIRGLKQLAKRLRIPIVVLSQLSREIERRQNKRPMQSDLRDSGSIEQEADVIIGIYRHVVYDENTSDADACELIIVKQRSGPLGTAYCRYNSSTGLFTDVSDPFWRPDYTKNADPSPQQQSKGRYKKGGTHAAATSTSSES